MVDTSHIIKLIRNCLGDLKILYTEDGDSIEWRYIEQIHNVQSEEHLHLDNRLRKNHILFQTLKMKVYLSNSVAAAIEVCDKVLKYPQFLNSSAACKFLKVFNKVFDLLDSRNSNPKSIKPGLMKENKNVWSTEFVVIRKYILHLQMVKPSGEEPSSKKRKTDNRVVTGSRKRGFLGFLINLKSYETLFNTYVEDKKLLSFILGHKLSQDHLEMFFGAIRSSLGLNNNPTIPQFKSLYRKLVLGACHQGVYENCQIQDDTFMPLPPRTIDNVKLFNDKYELPSENTEFYLVALGELSEFKGQALNYISGFIQKKIYEKEQCINCKLYIANLRIVILVHC